MTSPAKVQLFLKRNDPHADDVLRALIHTLENMGLWPLDDPTNFWRLNKRSLAILAAALDIPSPGSPAWQDLLERRGK